MRPDCSGCKAMDATKKQPGQEGLPTGLTQACFAYGLLVVRVLELEDVRRDRAAG